MKQERFTRATEASIDAEFANIGITELHVCHMRAKRVQKVFTPGTPCSITVVSVDKVDFDEIADVAQELECAWMATEQEEYLTHYVLRNMRKTEFPGISICACGDNFNRREGRIRAKRHLISHLMHQPSVIITLDKHRALYSADLSSGSVELSSHTCKSIVDPDVVDTNSEGVRVAALQVDVADRDRHIRDLMATVARQRTRIGILKKDNISLDKHVTAYAVTLDWIQGAINPATKHTHRERVGWIDALLRDMEDGE